MRKIELGDCSERPKGRDLCFCGSVCVHLHWTAAPQFPQLRGYDLPVQAGVNLHAEQVIETINLRRLLAELLSEGITAEALHQ